MKNEDLTSIQEWAGRVGPEFRKGQQNALYMLIVVMAEIALRIPESKEDRVKENIEKLTELKEKIKEGNYLK